MDTTDLRVRARLAVGAAEAYGSPVLEPPEQPCSRCATPCPAARPEECFWPADCPLEGEGRWQ